MVGQFSGEHGLIFVSASDDPNFIAYRNASTPGGLGKDVASQAADAPARHEGNMTVTAPNDFKLMSGLQLPGPNPPRT